MTNTAASELACTMIRAPQCALEEDLANVVRGRIFFFAHLPASWRTMGVGVIIMRKTMGEPFGDKIELEESSGAHVPEADRRQRMPEPIPVRLTVVEDAQLIAIAGLEPELDEFYIELLRFERNTKAEGLVYRADNARLIFHVVEVPPENRDLRPLGVEVPSLAETEAMLNLREIQYTPQKGLMPGQKVLLLMDPAGNWIELSEAPVIW